MSIYNHRAVEQDDDRGHQHAEDEQVVGFPAL